MPFILGVLLWQLIRSKAISRHSLLVILFYITLLIATLKGSKDYISYYSYAIQAIGASVICDKYIRYNKEWALKILRNYFIFISLVNMAFQLVFPSGILINGSPQYLFGIRIEFTAPYVLMIFTSMMYDVISTNQFKISRVTKCMFVLSLISVIAQKVSTAIMAFFIIAVLVSLYKYFINFRTINYWVFLMIALILMIAIVFLSRTTLFAPLLELLGEDMTFNNRTFIWASAIVNFLQKPVWGHGVTQRAAFDIVYSANYIGESRPAHNQYLHVLYEGGIISIVVYCALFLHIGILMQKNHDTVKNCLVAIFVFAICLMSIGEIQSQRVWLFFLLSIAANVLTQDDVFENTNMTLE